MRDWILEMRDHTTNIQVAIDAGRNDEAWRLAHVFQAWCLERINAERYTAEAACTLLSAPQTFLIRVLVAEGKFRQALVHTMYQGLLDGRNLKHYPKAIKALFRKCSFIEASVESAVGFYDRLKGHPTEPGRSYTDVQRAVESWK
jgi:hypothetical protein